MSKREVKRVERSDGKRLLLIMAHDDGFYSWQEMAEDFEDMRRVGGSIERTWIPLTESGSYASAEDAERDARLSIGWLRE